MKYISLLKSMIDPKDRCLTGRVDKKGKKT